MIRGKTRHQLFLPLETSKRLAAIAKSQKRARSDLLVEMVDAWLNKRAATDEAAIDAKRIERLQRSIDETRRETFIVSYALFSFLKHYLTRSAMWPVMTEDAKAAGQKGYQAFLDGVARRMGKGPETIVPSQTKETVS
ncbi:hypothetical protein [uncultured Sphingomonas sp.]|uniref:hypothetical protein n=1 Tax=uncultured Sphingomonas sp. TaxID=158754 RepID=UPI00262908C0|nr:hypothetical protein [uncultured Sphingomonas sp.]